MIVQLRMLIFQFRVGMFGNFMNKLDFNFLRSKCGIVILMKLLAILSIQVFLLFYTPTRGYRINLRGREMVNKIGQQKN